MDDLSDGPHRILYVMSRLVQGGPANQLLYLIEHLDRAQFDPVVLTLSPESEYTAKPDFERAGIPVHSLGLSRLRGMISGRKALQAFVESRQPALIHSQGLRPDHLSASCLGDKKRVCTLRNYPYDDYPMKFGRARGTLMAWMHLRALRRIDHPVACSQAVAQTLQDHGIEMPAIQNGVDVARFQPADPEERKALRAKLSLPEQATVFISVGALIERKDPETVIRGFLERARSQNDVLVLLGDGPRMEACRRLAASKPDASGAEGIVRLEGQVSNVAEYLRAADYFVSMSHSEGLPNTVMEALACGLPVVLSDIESHREFFPEELPTERFVQAGDPAALAHALNRIREADWTRLSRQARTHAVDRFSAEAMSRRYQQLYRRVMETPRAENNPKAS